MVSLRMLTCLRRPCQPIACFSISHQATLSSSHIIPTLRLFASKRVLQLPYKLKVSPTEFILIPCARPSFAPNLQAISKSGNCGSRRPGAPHRDHPGAHHIICIFKGFSVAVRRSFYTFLPSLNCPTEAFPCFLIHSFAIQITTHRAVPSCLEVSVLVLS